MSTKLNYKQVANVERRTWDTEAYDKKARERESRVNHQDDLEETATTETTKAGLSQDVEEEFRKAEPGRAGPEGSDRAFTKARTNRIQFESKIGERSMISVEDATAVNKTDGVTKSGVGWHCKVCDCFLKDNLTYLDHINGRKHQRKLGYSLRVERSTKDDLKEKLAQLKRKKEVDHLSLSEPTVVDYNEMVRKRDKEEEEQRQERRRKRKERKERAEDTQNDEDGEEEEAPEIDPAMAAMMGFSGFGGGKKNT